MTGHERIAAGNIRQCFNFEVGGMYNAYLDGETDFPTLEEMKDMIYTLAMNDRYSGGSCYVDCAKRDEVRRQGVLYEVYRQALC